MATQVTRWKDDNDVLWETEAEAIAADLVIDREAIRTDLFSDLSAISAGGKTAYNVPITYENLGDVKTIIDTHYASKTALENA